MSPRLRILFFMTGFILLEGVLIGFVDKPLSLFLRGLQQSHPALIDFFRGYTDLGKSVWYLWPSGLLLIGCGLVLRFYPLPPNKRQQVAVLGHRLAFFFASIAVSGLVTDFFKNLIGRARPVLLEREGIYGFHPFAFDATWLSMPSGHTTTAAALAGVLMLLFPRWKGIWMLVFLILAASRCMVNAHYLSDVLAGAAVGFLTTLWFARRRDINGMFPLLLGIFPIDKSHNFS